MGAFSRKKDLERLKAEAFDLLIVGGGASGAGVALDAASRGLSVALIEQEDFSSGTSCRSTKLIHGGVRYLELAIKNFDWGQLSLVREALKERETLFRIAPHLVQSLPLIVPLYSYWEAFYYTLGLKLYDVFAGKTSFGKSHWVSKGFVLEQLPFLKKEGLLGGIRYYDGQMDDARLNLQLLISAAEKGACVCNYVRFSSFRKKGGAIVGAQVEDVLTKESFVISAQKVVNATGALVDEIRKKDNPREKDWMRPSYGAHLLLDASFCPSQTGCLFPKTEDGRVLFLLPWKEGSLLGTTDRLCSTTASLKCPKDQVDYLLSHLNKNLCKTVTSSDILSSWGGVRPLMGGRAFVGTASLSRGYHFEESPSGLLTLAGGKWTTYRKMAEDLVDFIFQKKNNRKQCQTHKILLAGGEDYCENYADFLEKKYGLGKDVCTHLAKTYGSRAPLVLEGVDPSYKEHLVAGYPYLKAEVLYAVRYECAQTAADVLSRRLRLSFLNAKAAHDVVDTVIEMMAQEFLWEKECMSLEKERTKEHLSNFFT